MHGHVCDRTQCGVYTYNTGAGSWVRGTVLKFPTAEPSAENECWQIEVYT